MELSKSLSIPILEEYLRNYTDQNQTNWNNWIPYAMFVFNTIPHCSAKCSPLKLLSNYTQFFILLWRLLNIFMCTTPVFLYTIASENLIKQKQNSKNYYDKNRWRLVLFKVNASRKKTYTLIFYIKTLRCLMELGYLCYLC